LGERGGRRKGRGDPYHVEEETRSLFPQLRERLGKKKKKKSLQRRRETQSVFGQREEEESIMPRPDKERAAKKGEAASRWGAEGGRSDNVAG